MVTVELGDCLGRVPEGLWARRPWGPQDTTWGCWVFLCLTFCFSVCENFGAPPCRVQQRWKEGQVSKIRAEKPDGPPSTR